MIQQQKMPSTVGNHSLGEKIKSTTGRRDLGGMAAGGARRVAVGMVVMAMLGVAVSAYHAHRPPYSLNYMHPDNEGRPATTQDDHGSGASESKARKQRESVPVRPRR